MTLEIAPNRSHGRRIVHYPASDGKPMGETDWHVINIARVLEMLRLHFKHRQDVYVAGNNFIYFEEGNPKARVSPDSYVVFGSTPELRSSFFVWREGGRVPAIVFEYTSKKTKKEDLLSKKELYERKLRVKEYVLFDPLGDYMSPRLQGFRLQRGIYAPIPLDNDRLKSDTLDLEIFYEGQMLRFYDPVCKIKLPTLAEESARAEEEARRAEEETKRADDLQSENDRLREEIARLRGELT